MEKLYELQYHEDFEEKHKITKEEIEFLKRLQQEMNTQDHIGQADPRYWVIMDTKRICGKELNNPDGMCVYDKECNEIIDVKYSFCDVDEAIKKILNYLDEEEYQLSEYDREIIKSSYDWDSLGSALDDIDFYYEDYELIPVEYGMFLTHKAAQEHLRENDYHYSDNAHTYAKAAWRSSEEKLWKILQQVDFNQMRIEV